MSGGYACEWSGDMHVMHVGTQRAHGGDAMLMLCCMYIPLSLDSMLYVVSVACDSSVVSFC